MAIAITRQLQDLVFDEYEHPDGHTVWGLSITTSDRREIEAIANSIGRHPRIVLRSGERLL